jgi:hypothetical protein
VNLESDCKCDKPRKKMTEVAVYTVAKGKIVHEEFLYQGV